MVKKRKRTKAERMQDRIRQGRDNYRTTNKKKIRWTK